MKLLIGWAILAGLVVAPPVALGQVSAPRHSGGLPYTAISDFDGPYAAMPEPVFVPRYGPTLLPPREVYTVVRESGFSPLGAPRQRGLVYTISVVDRDGEDGRLVIDARTGRIIRFMPAYRRGDRLNDATAYGPVGPAGQLCQKRSTTAGLDPPRFWPEGSGAVTQGVTVANRRG